MSVDKRIAAVFIQVFRIRRYIIAELVIPAEKAITLAAKTVFRNLFIYELLPLQLSSYAAYIILPEKT